MNIKPTQAQNKTKIPNGIPKTQNNQIGMTNATSI